MKPYLEKIVSNNPKLDIGDLIVYRPPNGGDPCIIYYIHGFALENRRIYLWSSQEKRVLWDYLGNVQEKIKDKPDYYKVIKRNESNNKENINHQFKL